MKACCDNPEEGFNHTWQDRTGHCINCGEPINYGIHGFWIILFCISFVAIVTTIIIILTN